MILSPCNRPPFRAEHVGSLLRPKELLEARKQVEKGTLSPEQLRRLEDDAIRHAVRRQEEVGMRAVTDGEMRRTSWHVDVLCEIGGVIQGGTQLRPFENDTGAVRNEIALPKVTGELRLDRTIVEEHFMFLKSVTKAVPKLAIPSPSILHGLGDTSFYKGRGQAIRGSGPRVLETGPARRGNGLHVPADRRYDVRDAGRCGVSQQKS